MYVTEAMLVSMEEMKKNSQDMETHIKGMIETEARMHGLELDARRNARDLWHELNKHMANPPADCAVEHDEEHMHADGTVHSHAGGDVPHEHDPVMGPVVHQHTHVDGTSHAHENGNEPHEHINGEVVLHSEMEAEEPAIVPDVPDVPVGSRGSGAYLPDAAAQAAGMAPPTEIEIEEPAAMPDDGVMEVEDDTDSNGKS